MVRKALVAASFLITSLSVTSLSAQDLSFLEGLGGLAQMQQQTSSALPDDQSIAEMSQPIPLTQAEEIYRISAGDTIALSFLFMEDYISSGDFEIQTSVDYKIGQEPINTSLGPIDTIRSEMLAMGPLSLDRRAYMLNLKNQLEQINPYRIDRNGNLNLPGLDPILVSGLTVDEAAYRVRTEQAFSGFLVSVTSIPVKGNTRDNLELFGINLFDANDNTATTARILPASYLIGSGDVIRLQLYGSQNRFEQVTVNAEGAINISQIGPVYVMGITNGNLTNYLQSQVSSLMVGVNISASVISSRPIEIFIVGEVSSPGSLVVSAFSTLTDAIMGAGGVTSQASLRDITIIRDGGSVVSTDLYQFIIQGNRDSNPQLLSGDVIILKAATQLVSVIGESRRQAVFELKDDEGIEELITFAGGLNANADIESAILERWGSSGVTEAITLEQAVRTGFKDGDSLRIPSRINALLNSVLIIGGHTNAGIVPWAQGNRILDVIGPRDWISEGTDLNYVLIKRQGLSNGPIEYLAVNLNKAYQDLGSSDNIVLNSRDTIYLFNLSSGREGVLSTLIAELKIREDLIELNSNISVDRVIEVGGNVHFKGLFPYTNNMTITNLLEASGGLTEGADISMISVLRRGLNRSNYNEEHLVVNAYSDPMFALSPGDSIMIGQLPDWSSPRMITLSGEVIRPGVYAVSAGETIYEVIERAGGLTDRAFLDGAILRRESLKQRERQSKAFLSTQIESQLTALSVSSENGADVMAGIQPLLEQYVRQEPLGRLSFSNELPFNEQVGLIAVMNGDSLHIPEVPESVSVFGEVRVAGSHMYDPNILAVDYIEAAGGFSLTADRSGVIIINASGKVIPLKNRRFFANKISLAPGDTILVPPNLSINLQRNLSLATNITQIIYQMAVAVAAVNSLNP